MTNGLQVRHHSMPLITTAYTALTHDYRTAARMAGQGGIYTPLLSVRPSLFIYKPGQSGIAFILLFSLDLTSQIGDCILVSQRLHFLFCCEIRRLDSV
jgi:hypothetical protein